MDEYIKKHIEALRWRYSFRLWKNERFTSQRLRKMSEKTMLLTVVGLPIVGLGVYRVAKFSVAAVATISALGVGFYLAESMQRESQWKAVMESLKERKKITQRKHAT